MTDQWIGIVVTGLLALAVVVIVLERRGLRRRLRIEQTILYVMFLQDGYEQDVSLKPLRKAAGWTLGEFYTVLSHMEETNLVYKGEIDRTYRLTSAGAAVAATIAAGMSL